MPKEEMQEEFDEAEESEEIEETVQEESANKTLFLEQAASEANAKIIVDYLRNFAVKDSIFKLKLESSTQTIAGMMQYIKSEAKKQAANGVAMIEDKEVFGWAVHFIDENIKSAAVAKEISPKKKETKVKTNPAAEQLSLMDLFGE